MKTIRLTVPCSTRENPQCLQNPAAQQAIAQAAAVLRRGGTVAFPTETVYGLGANALDRVAVERIFAAKQRPAWDPLIVHVSDMAMLECVAAPLTDRARRIADRFWPGPVTLLLPKSPAIPSAVTAGRDLVGVRMPSHPVALALIAAAEMPVAAPSANRFGHISPTTAQHVLDDLDGRIDLVLDAGPAWCGVESTVIEVREDATVLYRPGAIAAAEIAAIAGPVTVYRADPAAEPKSLPSPGVGIRHYAPQARVVLADGIPDSQPPRVSTFVEKDRRREYWLAAIAGASDASRKLGVMLPRGWPLPQGFSGASYDWGDWDGEAELAQRLYAGLRELDAAGAETILCPLPNGPGLAAAIRDRLMKAAREK